ncbi:MAR-binding filament-like protein 1 [Striga hermonthica]|uniref:MAR-binding filament-like protein 1 n=1 Tax=Striga hermonthica TaxID=68872 RepID=A0A9N7RLL6_STRHE|nr:MAR-binding filament-like protein 1 [Striga hermonthica]
MGSLFLHSVLSPPTNLEPPFSFSSRRSRFTRRKSSTTSVACLERESTKDESFCKRRAILYMGFAALPFVNSNNALAVEGFAAKNKELGTLSPNQAAEQAVKGNSSQMPFLSLLNALGYLGSGVLAALYASLKKEKATSDATIESVNLKLKEKDTTISRLEKKFESDLLNEKEARKKALTEANEEKQSLLNQLELADGTVKRLGHDLQKQKKLADDQTIQIEGLQTDLNEAQKRKRALEEKLKEVLDSVDVLQERVSLLSSENKDKEDNLESVNSKLAEKENELNRLSVVYKQTQDQIRSLNLDIEGLKGLIGEKEKELELKSTIVDSLNADLIASRADVDETSKNLALIVKEYDLFKSSAEKKAAADAELLGEKEKIIGQLQEQLKVCLADVEVKKSLIFDLTSEKDGLTEVLNNELTNLENLRKELEITKETLENSRNEASDLEKQFQESRKSCSELEAEISKLKTEFEETQNSLKMDLVETRKVAEMLSEELRSTKDLIIKSNEEKETISQELAALVQKHNSLQNELVEAHQKVESAVRELEDEKTTSSSLHEEIKTLTDQISEDNEKRKILEVNLEESTESLDKVNHHVSNLSKDLEAAKSRVLSLEDEKDLILKTLDEQKRVSQEARENLEDANSLITRLKDERGNLESRGKKLEEQMASAKGEILRLKTQANDKSQRKVEVGKKNTVSAKKVNRKRKVDMENEDS